MCRTIFVSAVLLVFCCTVQGATYYVPDDYATIQDAINACVNGDVVIVRSGTYVENINFLGKAVTVMSESGPQTTIIDGGSPSNPDYGAVVMFYSGEGLDSVLEGFTVTNGKGVYSGVYDFYYGGGVFCSGTSPTIRNNIICGNAPDFGGGIYGNYGSSPDIVGNIIGDNTVTREGAGVLMAESCSPLFEGNTVTGNSADLYGGGVEFYLNCAPTISNNVVTHNTAQNGGGGILLITDCAGTIANNMVAFNSSQGSTYDLRSGGIGLTGNCTTFICNNLIYGNSSNRGGGIEIVDSCTVTIMNTTIHGNSAANKGGGIMCKSFSDVTIVNSILWDNDAPEGPEMMVGISTKPSTATISYSDVDGGQASIDVGTGCTLNWGAGMIDSNPRFAEPAGGDFHLRYDSPCKDAGDSAASGLPAEDFEGDPRIADAAVDMGADEFYPHLYCVGDVVPGGAFCMRIVGPPGTSSVTLAMGSGIQDPPQPTIYGNLYLAWPLRQREIGPISSYGIIGLSPVAPGTWLTGEQYPLQALVGPLGDPNSILTNLLVLNVE